jgi:serine/threonine protein kinase
MSSSDFTISEQSKKDPEKDFQLVEKLGEGSYGSVWKAIHTKSNVVTAVKKVPIENDLNDLLNEIKIMKQCSSPYIIKYYGSYYKESELWIIMEYCGGGSVSDIMKITGKTLNEEQIATVLRDALKGLNYLHGMKKIHRDIKAGNILLKDNGEGKLADFGVSGQLSDTMAKRQTVIGTPFWMAPEIIQEVGYDVKADIWSLGITAIEMAEGKPPLGNVHPMRAIFMIPSRPPPTLTNPEEWSTNLKDFISKCLVKNPDQRASATDLLKHPLILEIKKQDALVPLIKESNDIIQKVGREEAMGWTENSDLEEPNENTPKIETDKTSKIDDKEDPSEEISGTMKIGNSANDSYVPPFLAQFKNKEQQSQSQSSSPSQSQQEQSFIKLEQNTKQEPSSSKTRQQESKKSKYSKYSTDELKKILSELETKLEKEIENIKSRYSKQKKELESIINKKKKKL